MNMILVRFGQVVLRPLPKSRRVVCAVMPKPRNERGTAAESSRGPLFIKVLNMEV